MIIFGKMKVAEDINREFFSDLLEEKSSKRVEERNRDCWEPAYCILSEDLE